jgi:hypothetical protein
MRKNETTEDPELRAALAAELKARARGDLRHAGGWTGECAQEEWSEKRREYNQRYRERHRERERAMQPIYKARWKARQRGLEPFPLPVWDKESQSLEVQFVD